MSPEERAKALIFASNYGEAAAIEFFGVDYGLAPLVYAGRNLAQAQELQLIAARLHRRGAAVTIRQ